VQTTPSPSASSPWPEATWLTRAIELHVDVFGRIAGTGWSLLDLIVRIGLAKRFFVAGLVTLVTPAASPSLETVIEIICPLLLALGLFTRYASIPMLILLLLRQLNGPAVDSELFALAWLVWLVIHGAGSFSLDSLVRRGLVDSALPLAAIVIRASNWLRLRLGPIYLSAVRIWLACALLTAAIVPTTPSPSAPWLPTSSVAPWPSAILLIAGSLLLLGWLTRYATMVLALMAVAAWMLRSSLNGEAYLCALLMLLTLFGGGALSIDAVLSRLLRHRFPELAGEPAFALDGLPRVVIVGAGFGGLTCAQALRRTQVQVTLIDRGNYHLFQPLLYQVATAGLSPGDIAASIRSQFRDCFNTRVLLGTVTGVDIAAQQVQVGDHAVSYDYLVLATGATHSYFGKDQWQPYAPGLKRIEDATAIRGRLLRAFERAETTEDDEERRVLLTFLIVGAGPTGVELAGAIIELARFGMEKEFRRFDPGNARVILVDAGPRVLPAFNERLSAIASRSLQRMGVEVLLNSPVDDIDASGVSIAGKRIDARTVLWAAGVKASPAAQWLHAESDSVGRVKVQDDLSVAGHPNIFVIGDTALSMAWQTRAVPGLAPAAKQGGGYVARLIRARIRGRRGPGVFIYHHAGSLATIGRQSAVADFGRIKLWGILAWWLWGVVHIGFLLGVRNRLATMINWFWSYLTYAGGIRLITGGDVESREG
jgi:putative oxidoreductase